MTYQQTAMPPHTPGPYQLLLGTEGCDDLWMIESAATGEVVAEVTFWQCSEEWAKQALADARLLAAAPELLDALKQMLAIITDVPRGLSPAAYEAEQLALVAVAKAEGRATSCSPSK